MMMEMDVASRPKIAANFRQFTPGAGCCRSAPVIGRSDIHFLYD